MKKEKITTVKIKYRIGDKMLNRVARACGLGIDGFYEPNECIIQTRSRANKKLLKGYKDAIVKASEKSEREIIVDEISVIKNIIN